MKGQIISLLGVFCWTAIPSLGQEADSPVKAPRSSAQIDQGILKMALRYQDDEIATQSVLRLIHTDPDNAAGWKYSLVRLYLRQSLDASALAVCEELYQSFLKGGGTGVDKAVLCEIRANLLGASGQTQKALKAWQELFIANPSPYRAVKLAGIQKEAGMIKQGLQTVETGLKLAAAADPLATMEVPFNSNTNQKVAILAVLHNLKGAFLTLQKPSNLIGAASSYSQALSYAPDFKIAQRNLEALDQPEGE